MGTFKDIHFVIGLIGTAASDPQVIEGIKETFLQDQAVHVLSLLDEIQRFPQTRGKQDQQILDEVERGLRVQYGYGSWMKRLLDNLPKSQKEGVLIVDAISTPEEIALLREIFPDRVLVMSSHAGQERQQEIARERKASGSQLKECFEQADLLPEAEKVQERLSEISEGVERFARLLEQREGQEVQEERFGGERKVA